ncbi:MAG: glycosyltransferase family 9 protein [bacterium]
MRSWVEGISGGAPVSRILVIRRKALGDALVTLPAVLQLSSLFPGATIDLLLDRWLAPLFRDLARDLHIVAWPPETRRPGAWTSTLRAGRYDLVLDFLGTPRTALWTALTGAPLRVGYDLRWRQWAYNLKVPRNSWSGFKVAAFAGEAFLDPLRALGWTVPPWQPAQTALPDPAQLDQTYLGWVADWLDRPAPHIALVLSASWPAKAWPLASSCELFRRLERDGASPIFIPGPADDTLVRRVRRELGPAALAPPTNLLALADLLRRVDCFVGTDNGARHLAICLGVPTVTLFGPTDPRGWNPEDPRHVVVRTGEDCSPCDLTECPLPGHPCLDSLPAARVATAVQRLWRNLQSSRR